MFRRGLLGAIVLLGTALVPAAAADHGPTTLLDVDDGPFFYDSDGDCVGDTDDHAQGEALRHWHVGVPFAPHEAELAGGFGCEDDRSQWEPQRWTVTVAPGHEATVDGEVRYLWDEDVPGGGFNDVHVHVFDENGLLVYSTVEQDGAQPVDPLDPQVGSHTVQTTLDPGTYTIEEDIFSGEHTTWLTTLTVTEQAP